VRVAAEAGRATVDFADVATATEWNARGKRRPPGLNAFAWRPSVLKHSTLVRSQKGCYVWFGGRRRRGALNRAAIGASFRRWRGGSDGESRSRDAGYGAW